MPTIIRVKHRRAPFVVIDRRMLEDERLTCAACSVICSLNRTTGSFVILTCSGAAISGATRCAESATTAQVRFELRANEPR